VAAQDPEACGDILIRRVCRIDALQVGATLRWLADLFIGQSPVVSDAQQQMRIATGGLG
jgi:hypothetical protein